MIRRNYWAFLTSVALLAVLPACSSGIREDSEDQALDELIAGDEAEAGTDAVPGAEMEATDTASLEDQEGTEVASTTNSDMGALDQLAGDTGTPPTAASTADPSAVESAPSADSSALSPELAAAGAAGGAVAAATTTPPSYDSPAPSSNSGGSGSYTVQTGDTLMKIAFDVYGDLYQWRKVYDMNRDKIGNPNAIPPGTVLTVEQPSSPVEIARNGERYMIKPGDTLGTISDDIYGTPKKWRKLYENNRQLIKDPNRIFAGFYLYYSITSEEQQESEQLKQNRSAPIAQQPAEERDPAASMPETDVGQTAQMTDAGGGPMPEQVPQAPAPTMDAAMTAPAQPEIPQQ